MRVFDRYIAGMLLKGYGTVLLILVIIFSFIAFVQELEDVGKGSYRAVDALQYVAMTIPGRILDLAPAATLLGGILGLDALARGSELVAMRASGMSPFKFGGAVAKLAVALVISMTLVSQFIIPPSIQLADKHRILAIKPHKKLTIQEEGLWMRDQHQLLHIGQMWQGRVPMRIQLFKFDSEDLLTTYIQAEEADVRDKNEWDLKGVRIKIIGGHGVTQQYQSSMKWKSFLGKNQLEVMQLPTENLSISSLYQYMSYLRSTGQESARAELTFWNKIVFPLEVAALAVLAVPLGFKQHRPSIARQLTLGGGVGILLFMLNKISTSIGLLVGLSPLLMAVFPLAVLIGLVCYLFWKMCVMVR